MGWIIGTVISVFSTSFPEDVVERVPGGLAWSTVAYHITITLALMWMVKVLYVKFCLPISNLPGPWYAGLTDLDLTVRLLSGRSFDILHRRHCRYGPIMRLSTRTVSISDCKLAKEILSTHAFSKPQNIYKMLFQPYLPNIFTTSDPVFHRKRKGLLAPVFTWQSLRPVEEFIVDSGVQPLLDKFRSLPEGAEINLYQEFLGLTFDVIGRLAFGES
ncbi:hypothetical protein IWQ62_000338, partial [Dispira parvispora]